MALLLLQLLLLLLLSSLLYHQQAHCQQVLESWREGMELEKIHLLGHSFGGYLTAHYK